jgi:hypothetical protein
MSSLDKELEALRKRMPDDPWGRFFAGLVLIDAYRPDRVRLVWDDDDLDSELAVGRARATPTPKRGFCACGQESATQWTDWMCQDCINADPNAPDDWKTPW